MVKSVKFLASNIASFFRKLFGLPLRLVLLVILVDLPILAGLYLASQQATRQINRLESDLVVVQDTQVQILREVATKSAVPIVKVSPITVVGVK